MLNKILFCGAFFVFLTMSSDAQNTFPASGNVGIGTTTPTTPLEINGSALLDGGGPLYLLDINHGIRATFGQGVNVFTYGVPSGIFLQQVTGKVGIGTTSPLTALTLAGTNTINPNSGPQVDYQGEDLSFENLAVGKTIGDIKMVQPTGTYIDAGDMVFSTSFGSLSEKMRVTSAGNVGIGTTTPSVPLEVNGSVKLTAGSGASLTFPDGTVQSTAWNGVLSGGDYAESVYVLGEREQYQPGDLLVIDARHPDKFLKASEPYSQMIAGVYSTKPGLTGRRMAAARSTDEVPMAMVGIVPTKVSAENGVIKPGDLLVSSSTLGYAMKGTVRDKMMGAVVGKAMGNLDTGKGVIEVLVYLQ